MVYLSVVVVFVGGDEGGVVVVFRSVSDHMLDQCYGSTFRQLAVPFSLSEAILN